MITRPDETTHTYFSKKKKNFVSHPKPTIQKSNGSKKKNSRLCHVKNNCAG